jgi:hypothetical protein
MRTLNVLFGIKALLAPYAAKDQTVYDLEVDELAGDRCSCTFTELPDDLDADFYVGTVLDFGSNVARVVRSADLDEKKLTWQVPLDAGTVVTVATVTAAPLAGAKVSVGGGREVARSVNIWFRGIDELPSAVGLQYGAREQVMSGYCHCKWRVRADGNLEAHGAAHLRMVEQVREVLQYIGKLALCEGSESQPQIIGDGPEAVYVYSTALEWSKRSLS